MVNLETTSKQFLRITEVCELFAVSRRTIYYWIEDGKLPSVRIGQTYRIPVAALRQLLTNDRPSDVLQSSFVQYAQRTH